jgi:hypothetical protein
MLRLGGGWAMLLRDRAIQKANSKFELLIWDGFYFDAHA